MNPRQLALGLVPPPALGPDDLIASASSALARAWIARWPDWPGGVLALSGPKGVGKSHLAGIWAARVGAARLSWEQVAGEGAARLAEQAPLAIDGPGFPPEPEALLHLLNALREAGGSALLVARPPPARWPSALPDLASRLAALPTAAIEEPDDAARPALLLKLMADRGLEPTPDLLAYLEPRLPRAAAGLARFVAALDRLGIESGRRVGPRLARDALAEIDPGLS